MPLRLPLNALSIVPGAAMLTRVTWLWADTVMGPGLGFRGIGGWVWWGEGTGRKLYHWRQVTDRRAQTVYVKWQGKVVVGGLGGGEGGRGWICRVPRMRSVPPALAPGNPITKESLI